MKSLAPDLPVVLSSGYDASQAMSRFGENALAGFLQKPGMVASLLQTVNSVLERTRGR